MNTKHCIYRSCGNTSAFSPKVTFFSFPLKDVEKSQHWARLAGCDDLNLKNKFLCENHFSVIYISKTPRRTILLPNALPYRYDENLNDEEFGSEKNTSRDVMLLEEPLDDENDIIYSNTIEMIRHTDETDENVETLDDPLVEEEIQNVNPKIKLNAVKAVNFTQKIYDSSVNGRDKKVDKSSANRISLPSVEFNVTKRQKLHTSADNVDASNHSNNSFKVEEKPDTDDKINQVDYTLDNPDITTFIYKGEEYIQMPKRVYLQQRTKLDEDVKSFRNKLQQIEAIAKID